MILVLAFALQAAAPTTGSPIVDGFVSGCAGTTTVAEAAARAAGAGWTDEEPDRQSPLGEVIAFYRHAGAAPVDRAFRRTIGGRELHLWVRETIPAPTGQSVECRVYDFARDDREGLLREVSAWRGGPPTDLQGPYPDGSGGGHWELSSRQMLFARIERPVCGVMRHCEARAVIQLSTLKAN